MCPLGAVVPRCATQNSANCPLAAEEAHHHVGRESAGPAPREVYAPHGASLAYGAVCARACALRAGAPSAHDASTADRHRRRLRQSEGNIKLSNSSASLYLFSSSNSTKWDFSIPNSRAGGPPA